MSSMSAGVICLLIFFLLCKKSSIEFVNLASSGKPVEAPIELLSGQILCVQHHLKRVNSRARSFKVFCVSVCVTPIPQCQGATRRRQQWRPKLWSYGVTALLSTCSCCFSHAG